MECYLGVEKGVPLVLFSLWIQVELWRKKSEALKKVMTKSLYWYMRSLIKTCQHISGGGLRQGEGKVFVSQLCSLLDRWSETAAQCEQVGGHMIRITC